LIAGLLIWLIGVAAFALVHLLTVLLAATFGVWLFYVQHQFEQTLWVDGGNWDLHEAALHGSSYYVLPGVLRWFTANVGMHHIHHLCSRIPYYRLPRVLKENPELGHVGRLTLWGSLKCVRLVLWDENRQKLISFSELRRMGAAAQAA
jgi:omega-6 fatty acid desaturase (delta-12 desaturase)